mgnify:CR=1 FL=1
MKHIVSVTYSDPGHEFMSMKGRTKSTNYVVEARNPSEAQLRASSYFRSMGYKIHSAVVNEQKAEVPAAPAVIKEEVELVAEKAPVAPVPARKYIKGTPENKAAREAMKPRVGHPTNLKKEEVEQTETQYIEEKLKASDGAAKWIHDFVHSDNPKFEGKSKKERIQQALGAYYAAKRGGPANEEVTTVPKTDWSKYEKPTIARIKSGETKPVDRTNYDVPPGMRKAKKEGQVAEEADQPDPSKVLGMIKAAAKSKTLAKQASPKIELGLSKDNPVNEKGPKDEDITEAAELPSEEGKSDKKAALNKKVDASEKDTAVAQAKDKMLKGKKNKVVMNPQKDNVPHVVLPFNPLVGNAPGGGV